MIRSAAATLVLLALSSSPLAAQQEVGPDTADASALRTLAATRTTGEVRIDGVLDEEAWSSAEIASGFVQRQPDPGAPASRQTEARILYDAGAVYVGVRMYDDPDSIAAQLSRRDNFGSYSDGIYVGLDSYDDNRTAFIFGVNPRGVKMDLMFSEDRQEDSSWDAVWDAATTVDSLGWTAEFRIPLSQLRYDPENTQWGVNVQREIARYREASFWAPTPPEAPGIVSQFGRLTGLTDLGSPARLELLPYVSSRLTRAPGEAADPFYENNETGFSAGTDLKYGLTSGLTLTATINPDFGQVEVDPAEVNLSAFESFFPEKRPFFVEGAEIFRFGSVRSFNNYNFEEYFYSRRVGRSPQRHLPGEYVDLPSATTILGAAKVSGKVGGWSVGVLDAVTAEEEGSFVEEFVEGGETRTRIETAPVEPLTNYFVGRVRRDLRAGATVLGGMFTATNRRMSDPAFDPLLHPSAYFGGVDFEHSWADRTWTVSGYASGSRVEGSTDAIARTQRAPARYFARPDADYLELDASRTALDGYMWEAALQKSGNLHFSLGYKVASPGFEINDAGFQGRVDYRALTTLLGRDFPARSGIFRRRSIYGYTYHAWNFGGDAILHGGAIGTNATFSNFWNLGGTFTYRPDVYDDRLTRGGPVARNPGMWEVSLNGGTDSRQKVSAFAHGRYMQGHAGASALSGGLSVEARPTTALRLDVGPSVSLSRGMAQYVTSAADPLADETFGRRYLFAEIDQTVVALDTRADWTFTPDLTFQLFLQPYVAAGDYSRFKEFLRPRSYDFGVFGDGYGTIGTETSDGSTVYSADPDGAGAVAPIRFGNPDFTLRSLRGSAVLRWEYRPGSQLYFVWQQDRGGVTPFGDFDFSRDTEALFRTPGTNVFVIKATYWLGG